MGVGSLPTAPGIGSPTTWNNFSSNHPGIVQFCFADGSVRGVLSGEVGGFQSNQSWVTYVYLSGYNDGQAAKVESITN
jgi:hypothetical protein